MRKRSRKRRTRRDTSKPLINARTLSKSLRERSYYRHKALPKCLSILGIEGIATYTIVDLERQLEEKEARGHHDAAKLLRDAISIFKVAKRHLRRVTQEAMGLAFCGDEKKMRQMRVGK